MSAGMEEKEKKGKTPSPSTPLVISPQRASAQPPHPARMPSRLDNPQPQWSLDMGARDRCGRRKNKSSRGRMKKTRHAHGETAPEITALGLVSRRSPAHARFRKGPSEHEVPGRHWMSGSFPGSEGLLKLPDFHLNNSHTFLVMASDVSHTHGRPIRARRLKSAQPVWDKSLSLHTKEEGDSPLNLR